MKQYLKIIVYLNMINYKLERLNAGEDLITSEKGHSMSPVIKSGQQHKLTPVRDWKKEVSVGDIVYCKVKGRFYTHFVKAKNDKKGCQIGNNHGGINGWTKNIYGKVTEIFYNYG